MKDEIYIKKLLLIMLITAHIMIAIIIITSNYNKTQVINNCIEKNPNKIEQCQKL